MIQLLIIAPSEGFRHHVPAGFIFADEVFDEANIRDSVTQSQKLASELERTLGYLAKKYPGRLQIRFLNLWSPGGVWTAFRYRLRSFPAVVVNQNEVLTDDQLEARTFRSHVETLLSKYQD